MSTNAVAVPRRRPLGLLRRSPQFRRVWTAHTTSTLGDSVTLIALPTVAIVTLHAGGLAVGAISALQGLAWVVFALIAGVWIDRLRRRRVMIVCDLVRLVLIGSVPVAYLLGQLTIWQVLAVAGLAGVGAVFFSLASSAYLPEFVAADDLTEANARLELSTSTTRLAGPSLGGALVGVVGGPAALVLDAVSFLGSALLLRSAPARATSAPPRNARRPFLTELGDGTREVARRRALLWAGAAAGVSNFGLGAVQPLVFLFMYRGLHLSPSQAGVALTIGALGSVVGVAASPRVARRVGTGYALLIGTTGEALGLLLAELALLGTPILWVGAGLAAQSFFSPLWNVNVVTMRQTLVPQELQARVTAALRTIGVAPWPLGALAGGAGGSWFAHQLGDTRGFAIALAVASLAGATSGLLVIPRCLRKLRL